MATGRLKYRLFGMEQLVEEDINDVINRNLHKSTVINRILNSLTSAVILTLLTLISFKSSHICNWFGLSC